MSTHSFVVNFLVMIHDARIMGVTLDLPTNQPGPERRPPSQARLIEEGPQADMLAWPIHCLARFTELLKEKKMKKNNTKRKRTNRAFDVVAIQNNQ